LLAWVMPFAAVLIGGGFVVLMLGRWRRATPSLPPGPEAVAQRIPLIDPKLREQLDDQVREQL
jgi:cytochrome c-type biogenesis protein CcmH/NrfF